MGLAGVVAVWPLVLARTAVDGSTDSPHGISEDHEDRARATSTTRRTAMATPGRASTVVGPRRRDARAALTCRRIPSAPPVADWVATVLGAAPG